MPQPLHVLLIPMGTPGDVQPFVDLGIELQSRGHRATLVASALFRSWAESSSLRFIELGTEKEYHRLADDRNIWNLWRSAKVFAKRLVLPTMRPMYDIVRREAEAGPTVVVAQTLALGARLAHEKLGVPLATLHRQPSVIRSLHDASNIPFAFMPHWLPHPLKRLQFRFIDMRIDRPFRHGLNALRAELSLPPLRRFAKSWIHSPQLVLGLWPDWYAPPQPDWPPNTQLVGFNLQERGERPPSPELESFINQNPPPLVFTIGSGMAHGEWFYHASAELCAALKRPGVLVTRFADHLPSPLPKNVLHADYAPFNWLLPRSAAIIHHAGIGTVAQALAAGIPQVSVPGLVFDTFDTAARLQRLGVGATIPMNDYTVATAADALLQLLPDPQVAAACRAAAENTRRSTALRDAATAVETLAGPPAR